MPTVGTETLCPLGTNSYWSWLAVANLLRPELARKHLLDLRGVADPEDRTLSALNAVDLPVRSLLWTGTSAVRLESDFASFWSRASSPLQSLVELGEQRLSALGPTNFVRFRPQATDQMPPQFPDELYQDCLNIALNDEKQQIGRASCRERV